MVETVLNTTATLGEGVFWHPKENKVYWVDIYGKEIHATDPKTGSNQTFKLPEYVGTIAPIRSGGLLVALENGVVELDTETGGFSSVLELEKDKPDNRFNDGKCQSKRPLLARKHVSPRPKRNGGFIQYRGRYGPCKKSRPYYGVKRYYLELGSIKPCTI
ncbi:SMP-30/gluconolactonase/LRE family protein [Zobellia nedashkovskayae]